MNAHSIPTNIIRSEIVQYPFPHTVTINNYITNQYNTPCTPERRPTPVEPNAPARQRRPVSVETSFVESFNSYSIPVAFPEINGQDERDNEQFIYDSDIDIETATDIIPPYVTMTRGNIRRDEESDSDMEIDNGEEEDNADAETVIDPYEPMDIDEDDDNTVIAY